MNNNTTNKKKLELKKTAIANLTLSDAQLRMVFGGAEKEKESVANCYSQDLADNTNCTFTFVPPANRTL